MSDPVLTLRKLAAQIAASEIDRLGSLSDMLLEPVVHTQYKVLFEHIQRERQRELDEMASSAHPEILRDFAADAGYLIGLEVGKRLTGGAR